MFGGERIIRERITIKNGVITSKIEHHLWVFVGIAKMSEESW